MVELFSPNSLFANELRNLLKRWPAISQPTVIGKSPTGENVSAISGEMQLMLGDYGIACSWVYRANWKQQSLNQTMKAFAKFEQNVARLAA